MMRRPRHIHFALLASIVTSGGCSSNESSRDNPEIWTQGESGVTGLTATGPGVESSGGGDGNAGGCGWSFEQEVYACGTEGLAAPSPEFPYYCAEEALLQEFGPEVLPCDEALVTYEGCCDSNGDVWYCAEGLVFLADC